MPPSSHALLSASSAHRWMNCPPSAQLASRFPDTPSEYAREGSEAHELCEYKIRKALMPKLAGDDPTPGLTMHSQEMDDHTDGYAQYVLSEVADAKRVCSDAFCLVEQRVVLTDWIPEAFGTADCIIIANGRMEVIDFKYGAGVQVSAENNPQMMAYALGAYALFDSLYDIEHVKMTIYQPRRDNVSSFELPTQALLQWGEHALKPAAALAFKGDGDFSAGDWCRFCRVKQTCRARAEANILLAQHDFALPATLEDAEIEVILAKLDDLEAWAADVREFALRQALSGKTWSGFKLVEGRSNRRYGDEAAVAEAVKAAGFNPYETSLLGVTAMQKLLGKKRFEEVLGSMLVKPKGKPVLVPETDKREPINSAAADFNEENHD